MLKDALAKALRVVDPLTFSVTKTTESLLNNIPRSDYCYIPKIDMALSDAMDDVLKGGGIDVEHLSLFPAAASLLLMIDKWNKANYVSTLDGFSNNEHCIQLAVVKLMGAFFKSDSNTTSNSNNNNNNNNNDHDDNNNNGNNGILLSKAVNEYIRMSGQLFLTQLGISSLSSSSSLLSSLLLL